MDAKASGSARAPGRVVHRLTSAPRSPNSKPLNIQGFFGVFRYSRRALELVWSTSRGLTLAIAALTVVAGALPAAVAYVGSLIVDAVVSAMKTGDASRVIELVILEGV